MKTTIWAGPSMALALLTLPLAAVAQDRAESGGEGRHQGPAGRGMSGRGPAPAMIAHMQAREADDMALVLNLRAEQRPALLAFLQSMTPPPPPKGDGPRAPDASQPTDGFADHLDRMATDSARRSAADTQRIGAAKTFYGSLDPVQRRAFEALMRLRHGPGPRGPMPGGDMRPPRP
ncbi:MAG TPA: Spy/CpxP family protein refolding chaperone [Sphingomonas sp.]|nr:Spy/CpxP family protein refolding chaperone [Sphingomonas sp.]